MLDYGKRGLSIFARDGSYERFVSIPLSGEPSASAAVWAADSGFVVSIAVPVSMRFGEGNGARERFVFYSLSGDSLAGIVPRLSLEGECEHASVLQAGIATRYAASLEFFPQGDGSIIGGCTQSETIWRFRPEDGERATLFGSSKRPRRAFSSSERSVLLREALARFRRDLPDLRDSDIQVPVALPAWRSLAFLDARTVVILVLDSVTMAIPPLDAGESELESRFGLSVVDVQTGDEEHVSLPPLRIVNGRIVAAARAVFLLIELESGEHAILRASLSWGSTALSGARR